MNVGGARERLIRTLRERGIRDERVLAAIGAIRREAFVQEALRGKAYADSSLPIGEKQTISQPTIVARMTELLEPDGTGRVLEIGSGSGYQAAVLAPLFEQVYSIERIESLSRKARQTVRELGIENVHFKIFDGTYGWGEFAPYRGIVVTAAAPEVPTPLLDQLADPGYLVIPLASGPGSTTQQDQVLTRVTKKDGAITREEHGLCRFVPLLGKYGWPK